MNKKNCTKLIFDSLVKRKLWKGINLNCLFVPFRGSNHMESSGVWGEVVGPGGHTCAILYLTSIFQFFSGTLSPNMAPFLFSG